MLTIDKEISSVDLVKALKFLKSKRAFCQDSSILPARRHQACVLNELSSMSMAHKVEINYYNYYFVDKEKIVGHIESIQKQNG